MPHDRALMTPLLLLHGGGLGPWSWNQHVELLAPDFDCRTPVLPGHVGSESPLFGMDAAVGEVASLAATFDQPVVLAGLSLGGQLATAVASRHPSLVRAVVASGANARGIPGLGLLVASLGAVRLASRSERLSRMTGRAMGVPEDAMGEYVASSQALTAQQLEAIYRSSAAHVAPTEPFGPRVLVLAGAKEPAMIRRSLALYEAVGAATALVPGGKHTWPLSEPELFVSCIRSWLVDGTAPTFASHAVPA